MGLNGSWKRRRRLRGREEGMTLIGVLCILALVGLVGFGGLKLLPLYLNYLKVARCMDATAAEFKGENADLGGIRLSLEKHWQIEDISTVSPKEVDVQKTDGGVVLHLTYDDSAPYIADISLTVHFDKTVNVK